MQHLRDTAESVESVESVETLASDKAWFGLPATVAFHPTSRYHVWAIQRV
jgi:hypothetical protein